MGRGSVSGDVDAFYDKDRSLFISRNVRVRVLPQPAKNKKCVLLPCNRGKAELILEVPVKHV